MIVSMLSVFFSGSKSTRLLKHGMTGHTDEIVDVSWIAKPCGRSSRWVTLRVPPPFGVWLMAGVLSTTTTTAKTASTANARVRDMSFLHVGYGAEWLSLRPECEERQLGSLGAARRLSR